MTKWSDQLASLPISQFTAKREVLDMMFGPFERDVLPEKIVTRILTMIKEKQLGPGDKLPPERELAATMQVSRPSLRAALRALALLNIVEIRQGDGTYVTSLDPKSLIEPLEFVFSLDESTFLELHRARKILEVGIVELAAQQITDEEIAELEDCLARSVELVEDYEAFLQTDRELHSRITEASRNPILIRFTQSISQLDLAGRRRTAVIPGMTVQSLEDHRIIVAALKARDPEAARQAMLQHLQNVEQKFKQVVISEDLETPLRTTAEDEA
jgi:GntR family transcriptional repressor for pyruvate dehydrogenase complex